MKTIISPLVFVMVSGFWLCEATCVLPQPGKCSRDTFTVDSNEVCPQDAGNCPFNSDNQGLCHYQQGCADPEMSNWTIVNGKAQAGQEGAGSCGRDYYYSLLESPWLQFTQPACLKFTYRRKSPTALDVFLEEYGGEISTVLDRSNNEYIDKKTEEQKDVASGIRKIIFRAYGGGSAGSEYVNLFTVSVDPGLCTWSGNFSSTAASNDDKVRQWTSPLISSSSPTPDIVDCLEFNYTLPSDSTLSVSVQLLNDRTVTVWTHSNPVNEKRSGTCPLQVTAPFKILFTGKKGSTSSAGLSVTITSFRRSQRSIYCLHQPSNSANSDSSVTPLGANQPMTTGQCHPLKSTTAVTSMSVSPTSSEVYSTSAGATASKPEQAEEDNHSSTVIALAVVAAVAVAALLVAVVIFVWWRRKTRNDMKQSGSKPTETCAGVSGPTVNHAHDGTNTGDDAYEISPSPVYDSTGKRSPRNPYATLQNTSQDVTPAPATTTALYYNSTDTEAASYYNVGEKSPTDVSSYVNVTSPVTPSAGDGKENEYEIPM